MSNNFYISNKSAVTREFKLMAKNYPSKALNALQGFAMDVRDYVSMTIKEQKHIVTGRLWQSIHWQSKNNSYKQEYRWKGGSGNRTIAAAPAADEIIVGTNVEYADDVISGKDYTSELLEEAIDSEDLQKHINIEMNGL